ncbi:sigma-54-dependent transcriptional regulator [Thermodesulfobacteriota bacterium]
MKLLIVDDERNMRHMLKAMVEIHGYGVSTAENGRVALDLIKKERFDFILCDVKMPDIDGMSLLKQGVSYLEQTTVIMMSAYGTVDLALEAMKAGAYDFISKPFKADEVLMTLKKAEERERLRRENIRLKEQIAELRGHSFGRLVATSPAMTRVVEISRNVACYNTTVLITGESGTGKELVARGIHEESNRREKSFTAINCGSIPAHLLESELFGYVKGAFTGADRTRRGLLDEADGSTLFLDEIGELPLDLQVKLLRVLQEREIRPLGSQAVKKIDIRVVAATSVDLDERIEQGTFREDLFYRLNVVPVRIPPLRERVEDIPVLANHFLERYVLLLDAAVESFSPEALDLMIDYHWPGNVRELENSVQRALVVGRGGTIRPEDLPKRIREKVLAVDSYADKFKNENLSIKTAQRKIEASLIRKALEVSGGNKSRATELLEISYPSLLQKIKLYNI